VLKAENSTDFLVLWNYHPSYKKFQNFYFSANITLLLSIDFIKIVSAALVLASVLAWLTMSNWLQGFAYRIAIPWWIFLLAGLCNLALALLTICYHAIRAALANPVKSLRAE